MGIPLIQMYQVARYLAARKLRGEKRYPLVLMLEPLFQCNLACAGCGKIDYDKEILQKRMSVADALHAVDECGAPIVSIPGGEYLGGDWRVKARCPCVGTTHAGSPTTTARARESARSPHM